MAGFILFQLLCVVAPDIEVGNVYVNVIIGITLVSGVVFGAGLAVIAAVLIVGAVIAFLFTTPTTKSKRGRPIKDAPFSHTGATQCLHQNCRYLYSASIYGAKTSRRFGLSSKT